MKTLYSLLLIGLSVASFGQIKVSSEIDQVTVYKAGASVHRTASTTFQKGESTILLTDIPNGLQSEAIQVTTPVDVRLLKMEYRYLTPSEMGFEDLTTVGNKIREVTDKIEAERDLQTSLKEDLSFIGENSVLNDGSSVADLRSTDAYFSRRRREIRTAIRASLQRVEELQIESQKLKSELATIEAGMSKPSSVIEVTLTSSQTKRGAIEITYYSPLASWSPYYNIRTVEESNSISFELMGSIVQNTGEDWDDVSLALSTGNPSLGVNEPRIPTWHLSRNDYRVPHRTVSRPNVSVPRTQTFHALITDLETGNPLPFARVELIRGNDRIIATSDSLGQVQLPRLDISTYQLRCYYEGYRDLNSSIALMGQPNLQRIRLSKSAAGQMVTVQFARPEPVSRAQVVDGETIQIRGSRDLDEVLTVSASVYQSDKGESLSVLRETDGYAEAFEEVETVTRNFQRINQQLGSLYIVDEPFSIPSTGLPEDVWIETTDAKSELVVRIRPALSTRAYLIAKINDWESLNLQEASANFFVDGNYNGNGRINPNNTEDTMEIALGVDPGVTFSRNRINARTSKVFLSRKIEETFQYEISVRNTKQVPISIEVQEQFPISTIDEIRVTERLAKGARVEQNTGFITWEKELPPNESVDVSYKFLVSYPKNNNGVNLPR
ncbi:MAG: mucoidy inhibitor MuiA family protein [Flavobacteriia bacterium]|nr:mucoidy inhibitor MuiA family protein [Flavobacteriia bacterium]